MLAMVTDCDHSPYKWQSFAVHELKLMQVRSQDGVGISISDKVNMKGFQQAVTC
jgi:hypothetical protein